MIRRQAPEPCSRCGRRFLPGELWAWGTKVIGARFVKAPVHIGHCPRGRFRAARELTA